MATHIFAWWSYHLRYILWVLFRSFISLVAASVSECTKDMSRYGARLGMAVTCNSFGNLAGPPIPGAIIGAGGHYVSCSIFAGMVVLVAVATAFALQWRRCKN